MEPWQCLTLDCGLTLHGAAALTLDAAALDQDFARLDAELPQSSRHSFGATPGTGWTSIPVLSDGKGAVAKLREEPAFGLMPSVKGLVETLTDRTGAQIRRVAMMRQAAGTTLRWHFDNQALHRQEVRLLVPVRVPADAFTLIGHERVAYPVGQMWTGDFCFPHQVENPGDQDRIVLAIDTVVTERMRQLFPPSLYDTLSERDHLATTAVNLLNSIRYSRA